MIQNNIKEKLHEGAFIPAHPLALKEDLSIDEETQRRLTRYYIACGVDGIAVGVHTTQFEIRNPEFNYYKKVLQLVKEEVDKAGIENFIKVAGICGPVDNAVKEATIACEYGYHLGLLSMGGLPALSEEELLERTRQVAAIIPIFGFYLQPAVGGRVLSFDFWKAFCEIENVYAIKVATFNRYQTLDVVRAVCNSSRNDEIALYTGNDDNIIADLVTSYQFMIDGERVIKRFVGGLLGHYAVWTKKSAELFRKIKAEMKNQTLNISEALETGVEVTDMNAALFDVVHHFKGSIPGIHEVLRGAGLMKGIWCLNPEERLSPGQTEEISRVVKEYLHLTDHDFVQQFLQHDAGK